MLKYINVIKYNRNQWEVKCVISSSSVLIACNELLLKWGHVQYGLGLY